ncbi:MAG: hypothetical protein Q8R47_01370 [Nanoarchaeota archaeon]|nr:hypothetical protein [Nanoarchaeota archaeon]
MIQAYDYVLIVANLLVLVLFYVLLKQVMGIKKSGSSIKLLAIFGILFFVTALIGGSAITGFVTKDAMGDRIMTASQKLGENDNDVATLKTSLSELKKGVESAKSFDDKDELIHQIINLENKIDDLQDNNEDLKDDLEDLKDELEDLYALLPNGHY